MPRPDSSLRWTVSLGGCQITSVWTSWLGFFGTCRSTVWLAQVEAMRQRLLE